MRGRPTRSSPARSVASGAAAVVRAGQPHRPRELPERALGEVESGAALLAHGAAACGP